MALTEQQYKDLIVTELGDTSDGLLAANIDLYWSKNDAASDLEIRYRLAERDAIVLLLGAARTGADFKTSSGSSVALDQVFQHLLAMRDLVDTALASSQAALGSGGALGLLTQTAPILRDNAGQPEPNDRIYRGDPLRRRGRRQV